MAVAVTFYRPATGATVPTHPQTQKLSTVVAVLSGTANGDSQVAITHNLSMSPADISQFLPTLDFEPLDNSAFTANWFELSQNPNFVILSKNNTSLGGVAGNQLKVTISRPNTIVR